MSEVNQSDEQSVVEKSKPDSITVRYVSSNSVNIQDLEREYTFLWDAVKDWWVKWDELHLIIQGSEKEGERHIIVGLETYECEIDMKHPTSCTVYDKDFNTLEER